DEYRAQAGFTDEQMNEIGKEALQALKDYGASEQEVAYHWQTNPAMRSLPMQKMMLDAVRYRRLGKTLEQKKMRPVPLGQRPGSPLERAPESEVRLDQLRSRLDATGSPKDAAAYLTAKRAARR